MSQRFRKLLTSAIAFLAALALVEMALRVLEDRSPLVESAFLGERFRAVELLPDPELFWKLSAGERDGLFINDRHLRGYFPEAPKDDAFRILCVGDSCTFGAEVTYDEAYGPRLERRVRAAIGGRVEAVLAANPGYGTDQSRTLVSRLLPDVEPDVTVLYVGAWNDYVACTGRTDRQRRTTRFAITRLLARVREQANLARVRESFTEGDSPFGPRVPLDEFRENVDSMVRESQAVGSKVVIVIPPLPDQTRNRRPIAQEYWSVLRQVAQEHDASLIEADRQFTELRHLLEAEHGQSDGELLLFADWVHPSSFGHDFLASLVMQAIEPDLPRARPSSPPWIGFTGRAMTLPALTGGSLHLQGSLEDVRRVSVGGVWLRPRVVGQRIMLQVPRRVPPGTHPVMLEGLKGEAPIHGITVTVEAPPLAVDADRNGEHLTVELTVEGPVGAAVAIWVANELRSEPIHTDAGVFHLADFGSPTTAPPVPFLFETLRLFKLPGQIPEDGVWQKTFALPRDKLSGTAHFQGLVSLPDGAALTEVVTVSF